MTTSPRKPEWADVVRALVGDCIGHEHEQVGRCVYCKQCGRRLYQGTVWPAEIRAEIREALK